MNVAHALAKLIRQRYDMTGSPNRYPTEDSLAEHILEHAAAEGLAVGERADRPNNIHFNHETMFAAPFGHTYSVHAVDLGAGHRRHVQAKFCYGLRLELDPADAMDFGRRLVEEAGRLLPRRLNGVDVSGSVADIREQG